jgi:hypothetical protein
VGRVIDGVGALNHAVAMAMAKEEVQQAIAEYCAAQPNGGAGILICAAPLKP